MNSGNIIELQETLAIHSKFCNIEVVTSYELQNYLYKARFDGFSFCLKHKTLLHFFLVKNQLRTKPVEKIQFAARPVPPRINVLFHNY